MFNAHEYSIKSFSQILQKLCSNNQGEIVDCLDTLQTVLIYSDRSFLNDFPIDKFSSELVKLLNKTDNENISNLTSLCICSLLQSHERSTSNLITFGVLEVFRKILNNIKWHETATNCVNALDIISNYRPVDIGEKIGNNILLNSFDSFDLNEQKKIMSTVLKVTNAYVCNEDSILIPKLIQISKIKEYENLAKLIINNICSNISTGLISQESLKIICSSFIFIRPLMNITKNASLCEKIIEFGIDFKTYFEEAKTSEDQKHVLIVIINMLPVNRNFRAAPDCNISRHKRPKNAKKFAKQIQPILLQQIIENPLNPSYLLCALSLTLYYFQFDIDEEFLSTLKRFIKTEPLFVLSIINHYKSSPLIFESKIVDELNKELQNGFQSSRFRYFKTLLEEIQNSLKSVSFASSNYSSIPVPELIKLMENNKISKFGFIENGIQQFKNFDLTLLNSEQIEILSNFLSILLSYISLPGTKSFSISDFLEIFTRNTYVIIKDSNKNERITPVKLFQPASDIECIYNNFNSQKSVELVSLIQKNKRYGHLIEFNNYENVTNTQISILERVFNPKFKKVYMSCNSFMYDINLPIFVFDVFKNIKNEKELTKYYIHISEGDCPNVSNGDKNPIGQYIDLKKILDLLKDISKIHKINPNDKFVKTIHGLLLDPYDVFSRNSCAVSIILKYPFMFPFEYRITAFKLYTYDSNGAVETLFDEFKIDYKRYKKLLSSEVIKIRVNRKSIFTDGIKIFKNFCKNLAKIEVSFVGDFGIGLGPTREFFTLFSHELCYNQRKLFRSDTNEPKEISQCKEGMFLSPQADPNLVEILGIFIAKSIQTDVLIDINFNPYLFKFLRGEEVNIEFVDPMLAQSLKHSEGLIGLPFTYPGLNIPLIENGEDIEITDDNINNYIELVKSFTCGEKLSHLRDSFIKGFSSIFPFTNLDVFSEVEICYLLRGENCKFKYEDLVENVVISHGYEKDSLQIKMLFDILIEMNIEEQRQFIQFITGFSQLPIGGLKSLSPKLTIAKRQFDYSINIDSQLPTVMTCTNYFKLPPYSTKLIMKERIFYAIKEGLGAFQLT